MRANWNVSARQHIKSSAMLLKMIFGRLASLTDIPSQVGLLPTFFGHHRLLLSNSAVNYILKEIISSPLLYENVSLASTILECSKNDSGRLHPTQLERAFKEWQSLARARL